MLRLVSERNDHLATTLSAIVPPRKLSFEYTWTKAISPDSFQFSGVTIQELGNLLLPEPIESVNIDYRQHILRIQGRSRASWSWAELLRTHFSPRFRMSCDLYDWELFLLVLKFKHPLFAWRVTVAWMTWCRFFFRKFRTLLNLQISALGYGMRKLIHNHGQLWIKSIEVGRARGLKVGVNYTMPVSASFRLVS